MNKAEAANFLGVGVRSLERYTSQARIVATQKRGKTGPVTDYDEAELAAFKLELESPDLAALSPSSPPTLAIATKPATFATALARLPAQPPQQLARLDDVSPALAKVAPDARQVAPKLLWTLDEVSLLTGLSRARIRAAIEAGELKAGRVGRAFRVRPADVAVWVEGLF